MDGGPLLALRGPQDVYLSSGSMFTCTPRGAPDVYLMADKCSLPAGAMSKRRLKKYGWDPRPKPVTPHAVKLYDNKTAPLVKDGWRTFETFAEQHPTMHDVKSALAANLTSLLLCMRAVKRSVSFPSTPSYSCKPLRSSIQKMLNQKGG